MIKTVGRRSLVYCGSYCEFLKGLVEITIMAYFNYDLQRVVEDVDEEDEVAEEDKESTNCQKLIRNARCFMFFLFFIAVVVLRLLSLAGKLLGRL